jgi:Flp pilus assembly pilin Flp
LVVVESVSLLSLCVISLLYAKSSDDEDATSVEYTSVTAMVATTALLYFSLDSILLENIFQFAASQIMHMLIVAYVAWHYAVTGLGKLYDTISLYVLIGVCAFQLAYLVLIYPVSQAFGWREYKKLGSSVTIRPLYRTATIFFTLLKLDFALGVLLLLLAAFYLLKDATQIALNTLAMFFTLLWLVRPNSAHHSTLAQTQQTVSTTR